MIRNTMKSGRSLTQLHLSHFGSARAGVNVYWCSRRSKGLKQAVQNCK